MTRIVLMMCLIAASCSPPSEPAPESASAPPVSARPVGHNAERGVITVDRLAQACAADLGPTRHDDALVIGFCRGFVTGVVQLLREQGHLCAGSDRTLAIARRAATRMRALAERSGIDPYSAESANAGQTTLLAAILLSSACPTT